MSQNANNCFGELSKEDFLKHYWQKKPLLVRNAFPNPSPNISANELAGLACEDGVNSRIVLEKAGKKPWQLEHGAFDESYFSTLPKTHWSLLVSDVEKYLPEFKRWMQYFSFIPRWRLDDLMISYAPEGGSVGPHTDAYDVFLIQLSGQRQWAISENYHREIIADIDLAILKDFTAEQQWKLNAGDMLYLPPNVAHYGIAQSYKNQDCLTASVGCRAPSFATMQSDYFNFIHQEKSQKQRFVDTTPSIPKHPALISEHTIQQFVDNLKQGLVINADSVTKWLGHYLSDNHAFADEGEPNNILNFKTFTELENKINTPLSPSPFSCFLFTTNNNTTLLFVDGASYQVSSTFAAFMCDDKVFNLNDLAMIADERDKKTFLILFNNGAIVCHE